MSNNHNTGHGTKGGSDGKKDEPHGPLFRDDAGPSGTTGNGNSKGGPKLNVNTGSGHNNGTGHPSPRGKHDSPQSHTSKPTSPTNHHPHDTHGNTGSHPPHSPTKAAHTGGSHPVSPPHSAHSAAAAHHAGSTTGTHAPAGSNGSPGHPAAQGSGSGHGHGHGHAEEGQHFNEDDTYESGPQGPKHPFNSHNPHLNEHGRPHCGECKRELKFCNGCGIIVSKRPFWMKNMARRH